MTTPKKNERPPEHTEEGILRYLLFSGIDHMTRSLQFGRSVRIGESKAHVIEALTFNNVNISGGIKIFGLKTHPGEGKVNPYKSSSTGVDSTLERLTEKGMVAAVAAMGFGRRGTRYIITASGIDKLCGMGVIEPSAQVIQFSALVSEEIERIGKSLVWGRTRRPTAEQYKALTNTGKARQ